MTMREERIRRLLRELEYEVTRGMLEKEIGEEMTFRFYVPNSSTIPDGVVFCEFRTRPTHRYYVDPDDLRLSGMSRRKRYQFRPACFIRRSHWFVRWHQWMVFDGQ